MPTETRPVEPTMSSRLNVSEDSACLRTLKAPKATEAPITPATVPTRVARPVLRPRLWRPKSAPAPQRGEPEDPAGAEHGDKSRQQRRRRHAGNVKTKV